MQKEGTSKESQLAPTLITGDIKGAEEEEWEEGNQPSKVSCHKMLERQILFLSCLPVTGEK